MNPEQSTALLKVITELIGILVWPIVVLIVLVRFGPALREFFGSLGELTFKAAGVEATAKRRQAEAAAALGAALATNPSTTSETRVHSAEQAREVANIVAEHVNAKTLNQVEGSRVLWVDDRPTNNTFERRSLEALGIRFDISISTEDALSQLESNSYDVIISDMSRPPDSIAGYTLLKTMRERGIRTPFIIYAGSNLPEHRQEARRHGAIGSTNRADELFELVLSTVRNNRMSRRDM